MSSSATARTPLLSGNHPPSYVAAGTSSSINSAPLDVDEKKAGPVSLFPSNMLFIADLLQDLQKQMHPDYWRAVCKHVYVPIFDHMKLLQINADEKISGQQDNQTQIDFPGLLVTIANIKANLTTSCKGIDAKFIKKIDASLDELRHRVAKYICQNFPNYVGEHNKKADEHAAAIRAARFSQAGDISKMAASIITCLPVTLANAFTCVLCDEWKLENKNYQCDKGFCCDSLVTPNNPHRFWSPIASIGALAANCRNQGRIIEEHQAAPTAQRME